MDLFNFQTCKIDEFHPVHGRLCVTLVPIKSLNVNDMLLTSILLTRLSGKIEKVSPCPSTEDAMSPVALAPPEVTQATRYSDGVEQKHVTTGVNGGSRAYQGGSKHITTGVTNSSWAYQGRSKPVTTGVNGDSCLSR